MCVRVSVHVCARETSGGESEILTNPWKTPRPEKLVWGCKPLPQGASFPRCPPKAAPLRRCGRLTTTSLKALHPSEEPPAASPRQGRPGEEGGLECGRAACWEIRVRGVEGRRVCVEGGRACRPADPWVWGSGEKPGVGAPGQCGGRRRSEVAGGGARGGRPGGPGRGAGGAGEGAFPRPPAPRPAQMSSGSPGPACGRGRRSGDGASSPRWGGQSPRPPPWPLLPHGGCGPGRACAQHPPSPVPRSLHFPFLTHLLFSGNFFFFLNYKKTHSIRLALA